MKKKIFKSIIIPVVIILLLFFPLLVFATNEDFTIYSELDNYDDVTVASNNITFETNESHPYYVRKDFGAGFFGDNYHHTIEACIDSISASGGVTLWGLGLDSVIPTWQIGTNTALTARENAGGLNFSIWSDLNGSDRSNGTNNVTFGNLYKFDINSINNIITVIVRDENNVIKWSGNITAWGNDFRYVYVFGGYDRNEISRVSNGSIRNFQMEGISIPTVDTLPASEIGYDSYYESYGAKLSGNVTSDGGEGCTAGFYWRLQGVGDWAWYGLSGSYESGEIFEGYIHNLEFNQTYEYFAYVENSAGFAQGDTETFLTAETNTAPTILTLSYPIDINITDNTTRIYGKVIYDGGDNVTGWFLWKLSTETEWQSTQSSNTTDLQTNDLYNILLDDLAWGVTYEYQAVGQNDYGIEYGQIATFVLSDATFPDVVTTGYQDVKDDRATLLAHLNDDGGVGAFVRFQIRKVGLSTWIETSGTWYVTNDDIYVIYTGLLENTSYEFRAKATNYTANFTGQTDFGEIFTFTTLSSIMSPTIVTDNATFVNTDTVKLRGLVTYDGGSSVQVWFQYKQVGVTDWTETVKGEGAYTDYEFENLVFGMDPLKDYQWRAVGQNDVGISYGVTKQFNLNTLKEDKEGGGSGSSGETGGSNFSDWINQLKASLGLTGEMGTWAFMGLLVLLVSIIFGMAIVSTPEKWIKNAIAVAWLLTSVAITGAFLFTGQLGIFPILILVGGVVMLIILVLSMKLSGGGIDG